MSENWIPYNFSFFFVADFQSGSEKLCAVDLDFQRNNFWTTLKSATKKIRNRFRKSFRITQEDETITWKRLFKYLLFESERKGKSFLFCNPFIIKSKIFKKTWNYKYIFNLFCISTQLKIDGKRVIFTFHIFWRSRERE